MSGVEVAGLILGVFPLLLEGVKELQLPIKRMRFYWKFQNKFENFLAEVNKERIVYDQNLDFILSFLGIDPNDNHTFPGGIPDSFWAEPPVADGLRQKLKDHHFNEFITELEKMHNALDGLYNLLPIQKLHQTDGHDVDSYMFRLKTSFLGKKDDLLSQLRQSNEWIYRYLDRATRIMPDGALHEQQRSDKIHDERLGDLQNLQTQARSLYSCFQENWRCECHDGHPCGITVQKIKREPNDEHHLSIIFNPIAASSSSRMKVRVSGSRLPKKEKGYTRPCESKQQEIDLLNRQVSAKSLHRGPHEDSKAPTELLNYTLGSLGGPEHAKSNGVQKSATKLKKANGKFLTNSSMIGTNITSVSRTHNTHPSPYVISKVDKYAGLWSTDFLIRGQVSTTSVKGVRFITEPSQPPREYTEGDEEPIQNICKSISCNSKSACLGVLKGEYQKRLYLHSELLSQSYEHEELLTIKSFSRGQQSLFKRLYIGLSTVLLITVIGDTCWLTPSWATSGLFLVGEDEQLGLHPYIIHASLLKSLQGKARHPARSETFFMLGIIILELIFGEDIKTATQSFRSAHLGMDGRPNKLTEFCTAMEWAKMAGGQVGDRLSNGIEWCLGFLLDERKHLSSSECLRETWDRLVAPLEHFLELWVRDPLE